MKLFQSKPLPPKVKSNKLAQCFIPYGDTQVQEVFCHLIKYKGGTREIVKEYGGTYKLDWDVDFSRMPRVNAWQYGAKIAKDALIDLSTLDRKIGKMVMTEAQDV